MNKKQYMGVDIGTSGCKLIVCDEHGNVIFHTSEEYEEENDNGKRELNPEIVKEGFFKIIKAAGKACGSWIHAIAITSLGESVVCLDKNNKCLGNSIITGDQRGKEELDEIIKKVGSDRILNVTGIPPNELYGLPKYRWVNKYTNYIQKAEKVLFYEEYGGYLLTGKRKVSFSSAARSMAFDIYKRCWDEELLTLAGITIDQLGTPSATGTIIGVIDKQVAEYTGINPEAVVVVGGHDQICAAIGSGLSDDQTSECGMGTCEFTFVPMRKSELFAKMAEFDFPIIPYIGLESFLTSLEITTCGILKKWARKTFLAGIHNLCEAEQKDFYSCIEKKIQDLETKVMVLPQFGSSGNPDLDMDTVGTITGLTIDTTPEEIYKGILESFALQTRMAFECLGSAGNKINKIIATGGGAKSEATLQIRADVFNKKIYSLECEDAGTLGCAIIAAASVGNYENIFDAVSAMVRFKKIYSPNPEKVQYYEKKYQQFKKLYEKMH